MLNNLHIHHLGFIVKSLDQAIIEWNKLGFYALDSIFYDYIQNNKIIFMENQDHVVVELIEPLDSTSTISNAPNGFHHICFSVCAEDFEKNFKALNIGKIYTQKIIAPALNNRYICFAYLKLGINVEFILLD